MMSILYEIFYRPLFNALFFIYEYVAFHDLGLAIIILTVIVRLILYPLFHKSQKHQTVMQKIQPKIKEVQNLHKEDKMKQTQAMMALYKEHNVNPFSGIFLIILQIPIFIGLYQVFAQKFTAVSFQTLYTFIPQPGEVNTSLLGLINLYESSIILIVLAALLQYIQGHLSLPKAKPGESLSSQERIGRQMVYIAPVLTVTILWQFPSAVALYWATTSLFSVIQQLVINKQLGPSKTND
ncbi:MAG TPA: YidC/Oxa1 family membrane protein insertase [Candidatus Paceibacterota bacterium]